MSLHIDGDRIEKQINLTVPRSRVWRALTDHREFSDWFGVNLESPFLPGQTTSGQMTIPGYEHIRMEATVQKLEPESYFSYTWHPYAIEPGRRLFEGDSHTGRVHSGRKSQRDFADGHGIRFLENPRSSA